MKFKQKSLQRVLIMLLVAVTLLSGCQPIQSSTQPEPSTPIPEQPTPAAEPSPVSDNAAENTRMLLARQLHVDPATVEIVSDESVEWSDSCLGLGTLVESCAAVITPGHKITLRVDGQEYLFHTDENASHTRLAAAPEPVTGEVIINWMGYHEYLGCLESAIGADGVGFGICGGTAKIGGKFATDARREVLTQLAGEYASFEASTDFGNIRFVGYGATVADEAAQRKIARWAQQVTSEAAGGESLAGLEYLGPAEMGTPDTSKCAVLRLGTPIEASLGACDGSMTEVDMGKKTYLDWEYLRDHFAPFVYETASEKLTFEGMGLIESEAWKRAILAWARTRRAELASGRTSATISTAMSWHLGQDFSQKNVCMHLTVLDYGYAYADEIMCEGGDVITTVGDWLTTEELTKFDGWLYQRAPLSIDNNYIGGQGEQPMSEAEQAEAALWAMDVRARIAGIPSDAPSEADLARCPAEDGESKRMVDTTHRFCMLFPATHTLFAPTPEEIVIAKDTLLNSVDPRLAIKVSDATGRTLEQLRDEVLSQFAGFEVTPASITVDGVDAVLLDNLPGQDLNRRVLMVQNGRFYDLTFSPIGEAGDALAAFEAFYQGILDSWRFLDETVATPTPDPNEISVNPTDVQFVQALVNVNIRSGPGTNYEVIGRVEAGQAAKVTGITADGTWWRVICPDDTVGNCFVVNDPQFVSPTTGVPGEGSAPVQSELSTYVSDDGRLAFDYPASWVYELGEGGIRGGFVQYLAPDGKTRLTATTLEWDPKNDLGAFVESRKTAWNASGMTILDEQAWKLNVDYPALRFLIRSADGSEDAFFLLTTLGEQYFILSGSGDLDAIATVAQSLKIQE